MKNITFSLYAFHLQKSLDDQPDQPKQGANQIWESLTQISASLAFAELKDFNSYLVTYSSEGNNYQLPEAGELDLTPIPTNADFQLKGNLQAFHLNDTYCIDLTLRPEPANQEIALGNINVFQPKVLIEQVTADLGKVCILYGEKNYWNEPKQDAQTLADNLCQGTSYIPIFIDEIELFNCQSFLFQTKDLTIIITLGKLQQLNLGQANKNYRSLNLEQANKNYRSLRDLFWSEKKIETTYAEAKTSYQTARRLYSKLEQKIQDFYKTLHQNPEQRITKLDLMVQEIPQDLLFYQCCLRDLKTHHTTIKTNIHNFTSCLEKLLADGNKLAVWSTFAEKKYPQYLQQIDTYLAYFEPGKDLFSDLINTIRATAEIEQARNNQKLEDQIQTIGIAIAAAGIVVSNSSLIFQEPWTYPWQKYHGDRPHPFIIAVVIGISCTTLIWLATKRLLQWSRQGRSHLKSD